MRLFQTASVVLLTLTVAGVMFVGTDVVAQSAPRDAKVLRAFTEPSRRLNLAFPGLGVIAEVAVKEGDLVKNGQVLMSQDAEIEALEMERLEAEANSTARLEFAEADLGVKRAVLKRKTTAAAGIYPAAEIEEAELDVTAREASLDIAKLDNNQNKLKAQQQGAKVERMTLKSKLDGVVEKIEVWEGEMCDPSKAAIIVVKNDPAHVVIPELTTRQVAVLRVGETMEVKYPDETEWRQAKISFISPVADAASDTQLVRLELPNPENRATGLPIEVKLPAKLIEQQFNDKAAFNR